MRAVDLSLCFNQDQENTFLAVLLKASENRLLGNVQLNVRPMLWQDYKQELTSMALQNRGVDVSQVGFPLTNDLVAMNALRPISQRVLATVGGEAALHPTALKIANRHQKGMILGLPWMVDPRALFYWKDMLDTAGLDPQTAFSSAEAMESSCQRLQQSGVESPWVLGMADKFVIIHSIVSWVWGKNGDFISPAGTRAIFLEKDALDGMEAYFRLMRYMPDGGRPFDFVQAEQLFIERKAAITLGSYGSLRDFRDSVAPEYHSQIGVALPPGPPLLAGSDLAIWRHSIKEDEIIELMSALYSTEIQIKYAEYLGDLPVTKSALEHLAQSPDEGVRMFTTTLDQGRIFAVTKFAGMLEIQLATALCTLWASLSEKPADNLRETIRKTLEPVRHRFDMLNESA